MVSVKVEGIKTLKAQFEALAVCLDPNYSEPIIFRHATTVELAAKMRVPRSAQRYSAHRKAKGWGHLRDAIVTKKMTRQGKSPAPVIVAADRKVAPHAQWVEYGTAKMPAKPFLRPAWKETKKRVLSGIIRDFRALIIRGEGLRK